MSIQKSELNITNMGNITNATITIKGLTIIAGENSTGKTFITKSLYTILDSVYENHFLREFTNTLYNLETSIEDYRLELNNPAQKDIIFYQNTTETIQDIKKEVLNELVSCKFKEQSHTISKHLKLFQNLDNIIRKYLEDRLSIQKFKKYKYELKLIDKYLKSLLYTVENHGGIIINKIEESLKKGFKKNFQITNLNDLIKHGKSKKLKIQIDRLGTIEIDSYENIQFELSADGIEEIQNVENIVFFDSPVYIKIRKALQNCQKHRFLIEKDEDKYLKGYPQYLDKLYTFIDKEYIDKSEFNLISQEIQEIIKGKFSISKGGDIQYTDKNNNTMPLSLTAMGISNIGLIDLLLRNNVINRGSYLIMDEPEVHLHPE